MIPMDSGSNTFSDPTQSKPVIAHGLAMREVEGGFPHSEMSGSKPVRSSPNLIAAYHVLHRLSAPRHPPDTLKALDRSHEQCPLRPPRSARSNLGIAAGPQEHEPIHCQKDQFLLAEHTRSSRGQAGRLFSTWAPGIGVIHVRMCSLSTMSNIPRIRRSFDPQTANP